MKRYRLTVVLLPFFAGAAVPSLTACEDNPCGLGCPAEGIAEGNATISGLPNVDAFFGAVVDVGGAANGISASVRADLDAIAAEIGLEAGASPADIAAAIEGKVAAHVDGGLTLSYAAPKCEASLEATASAAAACDAEVDPGNVEVSCEGTCTIDASAQADCSAQGTLTCKGQAPNLACEGTCTGDCSLEVAATCEGTCRGTCTGSCSVMDAAGNCAGKCEGGTCQGTCELDAGGSCEGKCEGSCEYTPPSGSCDASAEAKCTASADANIECKGSCDGMATPPSVSAECKASVEAKADASLECTPPSVEITWQFSTGVSADAQAEFKAWIGNLKVQLGGLLAAQAKAEILASSAANLRASGRAALEDVLGQLSGSADLRASVGAACALDELDAAGEILLGSADKLTVSADAVVQITASLSAG